MSPVDPPDREPDYRFTLANERTFLAWMRTSLALLAGGIALRELVQSLEVGGLRTAMALTAVAMSLVLAVTSFLRWRSVQEAMRRSEPLPTSIGIPLLATALTALAAAAAVVIVLG